MQARTSSHSGDTELVLHYTANVDLHAATDIRVSI
jgi:hypothetical protein